MESRRKILKKLGVGTAICSLGFLGATNYAPFVDTSLQSEAPWWLLTPFQKGSSLGLGWSIGDLTRIKKGATILSLAHPEKGIARVHICVHNGNPHGVAHTDLLDFLLMDGGTGQTPTGESVGRALLGLVKNLKQKEEEIFSNSKEFCKLQTHDERLKLYNEEGLI